MSTEDRVKYVVLAAALLLLAGCASVINGTKQEITFSSDPGGAHVTVTDAKGLSENCVTPCTLDLKRKQTYQVMIEKEGFAPAEFDIEKGMNGAVWGNLILGGIVGFIVDFSNGAAYRLKPPAIEATFSDQSGSLIEADEFRLVITDIETLSDVERSNLNDAIGATLSLSTDL